MPFIIGSEVFSTALVAIAASIADPPLSRIDAPAWEACTQLLATIPYGVETTERPHDRSWPDAGVAADTAASKQKRETKAEPFFRVRLMVRHSPLGSV